MEFGILGPLQVRDGERTISLGSSQQRTVLVALLLDANRPVSVDHLTEALWGEHPPSSAAAVLKNRVSQLRKLLAPAELRTEPSVTHSSSTRMRSTCTGSSDLRARGAMRSPQATRAARQGRSPKRLASGAARHSRTSPMPNSLSRRLPGWRNCDSRRSRTALRQIWPPGGPPRSCRSWRLSARRTRCVSGYVGS